MASKRKQDEKHLNLLRSMVKLEANKQCFDCSQKGPTYIDMTIGSFVCTSCSGLLRGLNPPHRVKSMSMASFTPEEIEFIKERGNYFNQKVWLGLYNRSHLDFDSKDENKIKDFMAQKYEKKRYYVAPTQQMHEEARKMNTPAQPEPKTRPLRSIGNVPKLAAQNNIIVNQTQPRPGVNKPAPTHPIPHSTQQAPAKARIDLLSDLGGDPFQPTQKQAQPEQNEFADFAAFGNMPGNSQSFPSQQASAFPIQQPNAFPSQQQTAFPNQGQPAGFSSGGMLSPMNSAQPQASSQQSNFGAFPPQNAAAGAGGGGDKYSALADLDSEFSAPPAPSSTVNWNQTGGGGSGMMPWGGGGGVSIQSASSMGTQFATSSNTGMNSVSNPFNTAPGQSMSQSPASQGGGNSANPFANSSSATYGSSPANSQQFGANAQQYGANSQQFGAHQPPFGANSQQFGAFGQGPSAGFIQSPSSNSGSMFGGQMTSSQGGNPMYMSSAQVQANPQSFGGIPNGGVMAGSPTSGWGSGANPSANQMTQFQTSGAFANQSSGGFGQPKSNFGMAPNQQNFGSWGTNQPSANPFMSITNQAGPPKASNSTNPFL